MRVVLDTNILISGIFFHGTPGKILDAWVNDDFSIFVTPEILDEYSEVILRLATPKSEELAFEWLNMLFGLCHIMPGSNETLSYCRDPKDDKFIDCALSAKANYLVSGDMDLLVVSQKLPFEIISARKFLSSI